MLKKPRVARWMQDGGRIQPSDGRTDGRTDARPFLWILTRRDASEGAKKGLRSRLAYSSPVLSQFSPAQPILKMRLRGDSSRCSCSIISCTFGAQRQTEQVFAIISPRVSYKLHRSAQQTKVVVCSLDARKNKGQWLSRHAATMAAANCIGKSIFS